MNPPEVPVFLVLNAFQVPPLRRKQIRSNDIQITRRVAVVLLEGRTVVDKSE